MPHEIPTSEPTELTAGTTWRWDRHLPDHPSSDGWALKYALRGPVDNDITTTPSGDVYQVRLAVADTEVGDGPYHLIGYVENAAGDRFIVYDAQLLVLRNPLAAVNSKSHAAKMLEIVQAALEGRLPKDQEEVTINGTAVKKIPIGELERLRGVYASRVKAERGRGKLGQRVEVRFGSPR